MFEHDFHHFVQLRKSDLKRIARGTNGELDYDDLVQEAWLVALEISTKRAQPFRFLNPDDQDTLLAWLHSRLVKYANKVVRFAVKLGNGDDEDRETLGAMLTRMLSAPIESDPQMRLLAAEGRNELLAKIQRSYSQAAAYALLLVRLDWDFEGLAALLWIQTATVKDRIKRIGLIARVQSSLFDGIEEIEPAFIPWRKRWYRPGKSRASPENQLTLF
ncbi:MULTISPECIES: hypothetical protein [unclassified Lysobacter]|uniref:hypothetical protein n=1 Tax=unclassified Lysobacter TaxID=2635362 RepID=UPI001BE53905|nr:MULTISPECIES: hypothetical protein [unclassified Lysobacter]MBT2748644.1 hypothetical protein [Lysobacter sp. ISL-42]MBT2751579.1 hypothetical protein [Lysobacter sp. ISL-50]MBT2775773.1 hypothetical protein [Lysobacter sp. ISL-54]MBT2782262.1 hypothetical protein [Lysobacter sp. ISL-52]